MNPHRTIAAVAISLALFGCNSAPSAGDRPPASDGVCSGRIKGNVNVQGERIYHMPGQRYYTRTNPERWFCTEDDAQKAGFRRSKV